MDGLIGAFGEALLRAMGGKVIYLALFGTFLGALGGLGGGFILDTYDTRRTRLGYFLLLTCVPAGAFFVWLGLNL